MSFVTLDTGFNIEIEFPIAPFHKRLVAWVLDIIIQLAYIWPLQKLFALLKGSVWTDHILLVLLFSFPLLFYHLISELFMNGQSPGKKIMGLKVITTEGGRPSISQYLLRWMFRMADLPYWILALVFQSALPPWCMLFVFSGLACIILSKRSQRIGDLIAGTVLIEATNKTSWQDTIFMEVEENYQPMFPEVMRLTDRDMNSIRQVLMLAENKYHNRNYAENVAAKVKKALQIDSDMDCIDFLEKLIKDYNFLSSR